MNKTIAKIIDDQFNSLVLNTNNPDVDKIDDGESFVIILDKNKIVANISSNLGNAMKVRANILMPYLKRYVQSRSPKNFKILLNLADLLPINYEYNIPILSLTRHRDVNNSILLPNIDFFTSLYSCLYTSFSDIPYDQKQNSSFFIGSSTGSSLKNNTRAKFCQACGNIANYYAFIILNQGEKEDWEKEYPDIMKYVPNRAFSIQEQLQHKVVINIDGNTLCWSRLYWQVASNSIPVYINPNQQHVQFMDYISSDKTYIPCSLDTAISTIDNILNHYSLSDIQSINENGKEYIHTCFDEYMSNPELFLQEILNTILDRLYSIYYE